MEKVLAWRAGVRSVGGMKAAKERAGLEKGHEGKDQMDHGNGNDNRLRKAGKSSVRSASKNSIRSAGKNSIRSPGKSPVWSAGNHANGHTGKHADNHPDGHAGKHVGVGAGKHVDGNTARCGEGGVRVRTRGTRWLAPWKDSTEKPVIYHCVTRVVDRRFALEKEDKEKLRTLMRMQENFSGCRVLAYCLMSNHIHLLMEVPPMPAEGLSDEDLLQRLKAGGGNKAEVTVTAKRLAEYRKAGAAELARELHEGYTYRMHDLGEFMKALLQRFSRWHNVKHKRTGTLWESRFKSVLVEDGTASRMMAAYIDLNPVRAGIVTDPAEYRWSSYGEAMGGGAKGNGKKARAGLVRALLAHKGCAADARHWPGEVAKDYRMLLFDEGEEKLKEVRGEDGKREVKVVRKGIPKEVVEAELDLLDKSRDVALARMLRYRVRYFTDGVVLGSRGFVDGVFSSCRDRFGAKRTSGARKLRGSASAAAGVLWSVRDLKKGIG